MNPSNNDYYNLPKETEIVNGNFQRYELPLLNKFYSTWLIEFVQLLYETDQKKRPTASEALGLLLGFQNNPQVVQTYIQLKSKKNNNFVNNYNIIWRRQNNINNNLLPNIPNYRMSTSFDQINPNALNISPNINFARSNTVEIGQKKNNVQEFLQPNQGKENRILSSMKSLLQVFYRIDLIKFIKVQFFSLFSNCQLNYSQFYLYSFNDMLEIRDTLQQPILMVENKDKSGVHFIIPSNTKLLYKYTLKQSDIEKQIKQKEDKKKGNVNSNICLFIFCFV